MPGTERKDRIPDIEKAATKYRDARDERMEMTKDEVKTRAALIAAMKAHNLAEYRCDDEDMLVILKTGEDKVKVKKISEPGDDDDDADEPEVLEVGGDA